MSVLDQAEAAAPPIAMQAIPPGATGVVAQGSTTGWSIIFTTPDGAVETRVGNMERAVKLASMLSRVIARKKEKVLSQQKTDLENVNPLAGGR